MKTIALVEDEEATRISLSVVLRKAGYSVTAFSNGEEAYASLTNPEGHFGSVDLLVTDLFMPHLDGLAMIEKLSAARHIPGILVISAYANRDVMHSLRAKGISHVLAKPFSPDELIDKVNSLLHRAPTEKTCLGRPQTAYA